MANYLRARGVRGARGFFKVPTAVLEKRKEQVEKRRKEGKQAQLRNERLVIEKKRAKLD